MKRKSFMKNLKAISPVIATITIVAIAIVMAIAVAYWMLGLGGAFTRYEKLEIPTAYAVFDGNATQGSFNITMVVKNMGSATATIDTSLCYLMENLQRPTLATSLKLVLKNQL